MLVCLEDKVQMVVFLRWNYDTVRSTQVDHMVFEHIQYVTQTM